MRWFTMSVFAALAACSSSEDVGNGATGGDAGTNATAVGGSSGEGGQSGSAAAGGGTMGQGGASMAGSGGAPNTGGASNTGGGGTGVIAKGTPGVWEAMLKWPADTKPISGDGILADPAKPSDF